MLCSVCQCELGKSRKVSFHAKLENVTPPKAVYEALKDFNFCSENSIDERYLCRKCHGLLSTYARKKAEFQNIIHPTQSGTKRPSSLPMNNVKRTKVTDQRKEFTFKKHAIDLLQQSKYASAIWYLISKSRSAANAFTQVMERKIKSEMQLFANQPSMLSKPVSLENISNFDWQDFLNEAANYMPTLHSAIVTAATSTKRACQLKRKNINPQVATAICSILYTRKPKKWNFVQAVNGIMLYRGGISQKVANCLHRVGVSQTYNAALKNVDKLGKQGTTKLLAWKAALEAESLTEEMEQREAHDSEVDCSSDESQLSNNELDEVSDDEPLLEESLLADTTDDADILNSAPSSITPGYSMCYDNVGLEETSRHQGKKSKTMHVWTSCFAVLNRVNVEPQARPCYKASSLPYRVFLPCQKDLDSRRNRMSTIVRRILVAHFPYFESCSVEQHIQHRYSQEMSVQSNISNIGIILTNPGTVDGSLTVLDKLNHYVPQPNGPELPPSATPVHGDAGSIMGMLSAKNAQIHGMTPEERLEGIWPVPGEFHRRMIQMQDSIDMMFTADPTSASDRGTLSNIKTIFSLKSVKAKVSDAFNHVEDMLHLAAKGLVVLVAMALMKLRDESDADEERQEDLESISESVTSYFWHQPSMSDIQAVIEADEAGHPVPFCSCKKHIDDEPMIECGNLKCSVRWFHIKCMDLDADNIPSEWYCSEACGINGFAFCVCRRRRDESLINCMAGDQCTRGVKYHKSCIGFVTELETGENEWCCCKECRELCQDSPEADHVQLYNKALGFCGLLDMVTRDVVREGDGEAINAEWRNCMLEYIENNHHKYFLIGHMLLAGMNGLWSAQIAEEISWNRTVNIHGGDGKNVPMDRYNEFVNADFKGILKHSSGKYSNENVLRAGRIAGAMGAELDRLYVETIANSYISHHSSKETKEETQKDIVTEFVQTYEKDDLVKFHRGREYRSFPNFQYIQSVRNPLKVKKTIQRHGKKIDNVCMSYPNSLDKLELYEEELL